jgi:PAS domain S-box-containing protein
VSPDPARSGTVNSTFEQLLEATPDAIVGVDEEGKIVLVNGQTEALFGYAREDLLGEEVGVLASDRFRDLLPHHVGGYFVEPRTQSMGAKLKLDGRRQDGSEVPAEISLSSIEADGGLLVTAAIRDATEGGQPRRSSSSSWSLHRTRSWESCPRGRSCSQPEATSRRKRRYGLASAG